ncbi:MAG: hypothetical protein Mars2KO_22960 [Maribacter sp.]
MIGEIKRVNILVVEDETILAQDIENRLRAMEYNVVGIAATAEKAIQLIDENNDVDIILLDIIIKGELDGIELARIINKDYGLPFIFLSSHADRHLVERAKSVHPYAYILKPFNDRQVSVALELALVNFSKGTFEKKIIEPKRSATSENQVLQINDSLFLKKNDHFERVLLKEILFLEADSNYTTIHTQCGGFLYSMVLKKIEAQLPTDLFLRIHRSYIVNITNITGFEGNLLYIKTKKLPVSRTHHDEVFNLFRKI